MGTRAECRNCRQFIKTPLELEALFPGLTSLSSCFASVRADDGLCIVHERYVAAQSTCGQFRAEEGLTQTDRTACCEP